LEAAAAGNLAGLGVLLYLLLYLSLLFKSSQARLVGYGAEGVELPSGQWLIYELGVLSLRSNEAG